MSAEIFISTIQGGINLENIPQKVAEMVEMLPEEDQELAYEVVRRIVVAWDPDYTKVTPKEAQALAEAEEEFNRGEYYTMTEEELKALIESEADSKYTA